ncbi:MAG TPA: hypothetical protein VIJ94_04700 [Caulobacteraceae bacterium]
MKRMLIAAAALSAFAGAAVAQPAFHRGEGGPPPAYPACSHPHEDRCAQHGGGGWHGGGGYHRHWGHEHWGHAGWGHRWHHHHHSSTDGERG